MEIKNSARIAPDLCWSKRRAKGSVFGIRDLWRNAEDRRKDKQDGGFICFHGPKLNGRRTVARA